MKIEEERPVNEDELQPHHIDKFSKISPKLKINVMKFWVAGLSFFLSFMTTQAASNDSSTEILVQLILLTLSTEFVTTKIIIAMNKSYQPTLKYLPFNNMDRKKVKSLLSSMLYSVVMMLCSYLTYWGIVSLFNVLHLPTLSFIMVGSQESMEPFTFGLLSLGFDQLWLFVKNKMITKKVEKED